MLAHRQQLVAQAGSRGARRISGPQRSGLAAAASVSRGNRAASTAAGLGGAGAALRQCQQQQQQQPQRRKRAQPVACCATFEQAAGIACAPPLLRRPSHPQQQQQQQQRERRRAVRVAAAPGDGSASAPMPGGEKQPGFLAGLYKSLRDFGMGRSSILEGGVGLFLSAGVAAAIALVLWAKGVAMRKAQPYQAVFEFPLASGISVGTPVRIRGVQVGSVLDVRPSLDRVDVLVEVNDATSAVIPRNSVIEANQSGLIAEPLVDITPQLPLPTFTRGPLEPGCEDEGAIVCHNGHIKGQQGVALDDLVYIMTRMARQMEAEGIDKIFAAAEQAAAALEEATPLLEEATHLAREITPLLQELRQGGLVGNLEHLTEAAAAAASDIQALQAAVLTDDNVRALRASVQTLCRTLEHVESISADMGAFSRDAGVQRNLKTLIQALSRIIEE
ncbi:hypothetical protein Rsub_05711 [Raphidocelis subcapitata]|uniref:Mce/MlaD domain-containing protein n=1 Tax=Raphidocelis subcapitata TaxID=307507 RepID=A0A2V0P5G4_9CHLO|nr:hypothetical protein Rsub_05711 [Raphidocelis subcapitata]|eukprot:GBF93100.1 hypothetical protein Rsub_05711 [Raphidocelis subcapitata]